MFTYRSLCSVSFLIKVKIIVKIGADASAGGLCFKVKTAVFRQRELCASAGSLQVNVTVQRSHIYMDGAAAAFSTAGILQIFSMDSAAAGCCMHASEHGA